VAAAEALRRTRAITFMKQDGPHRAADFRRIHQSMIEQGSGPHPTVPLPAALGTGGAPTAASSNSSEMRCKSPVGETFRGRKMEGTGR